MSAMSPPPDQQASQTLGSSTDTLRGVTERLEKSRRLMCAQMFELNAGSAQAKSRDRGTSSNWWVALSAIPVLGPLISDAASWWADHPLRAVADLFSRPGTSVSKPLTQRHPWAMLIGAAAVGALVMWTRPWRFALLRRAVYSGLLPQVVSSVLARVPTDGLLNLAQSVWQRPAQGKASPAPAVTVQQAPRRSEGRPSTLH